MTPDRPEIEYPCPWGYRLIGTDEREIRIAVVDVLGAREYDLTVSRTSSGGRYVSLSLRLHVADEADRDAIYEALRIHPATTTVL